MDNYIWWAIGFLFLAIILLVFWVLKLINDNKRTLVLTKEEINMSIKSLETELAKVRKELILQSRREAKKL